MVESASDYLPNQWFENTEFNNVHDDAIAHLMDPPSKWNNLDDCIGFPCTAPYNVVFDFKDTEYSGSTSPKGRERNFKIIPDTPGASEAIKDCEFKESWNAWFCTN